MCYVFVDSGIVWAGHSVHSSSGDTVCDCGDHLCVSCRSDVLSVVLN